MSTILLPALRKEWHNLCRYTTAGVVSTLTGALGVGTGPVFGLASGAVGSNLDDVTRIPLANIGLAPGDVISARAEVAYDAPAVQDVRFRVHFLDAAGAGVAGSPVDSSPTATPTGFVTHQIANLTIPANTAQISLQARVSGGTGTCRIRRAAIYRGASVGTYETPKRGAVAPFRDRVPFGRNNEQSALVTNAGTTQITSFPSRLWVAQFETIILEGAELREWSLALDQLSDITNVFRLVPPEYTGPSTGYAGANPAVNGASQLGTSLICDGVDLSTAIVKAGDFASFEVTTALGNTNVQLFKIAADATSNGSGQITLTFTTPIRQAPADNAVVQIFSPTAQFRFVTPRYVNELQLLRRGTFSVDAIERVYP